MEKTNALINNISWCDCEVVVSEINKGLKNSIVSGLEYVFREYDAVVVLEDDCVPHPLFMSYRNQALNYYNDFKKVYCVTGFAHPFDVEANGTDVYFAKRICTWGWGHGRKNGLFMKKIIQS